MFRSIIRESALTNQKANIFFEKRLFGDYFNGDTSLVATLRAIIYPRMGEEDVLCVSLRNSNNSKSSLKGRPANESLREMFAYLETLENNGYFIVHSLNGGEEDNAEVVSFLDENFVDNMPGFTPVQKIAEFYKSFKVRCFVNEERKITLLVVDRLDVRKFHYLQAAILPAVPWYYDVSKGVAPEELELLRAFKEKESAPYLAAIEAISAKYDFRTPWLRSMLTDFEVLAEKEEIRHLERNIENSRRRVNELKESIGTELKSLDKMLAQHYGLSWRIGEAGESEILDYLLCNKSIHVDSIEGPHMFFAASGYLTNFDDDMAESVINQPTSYLYQNDCGYTHDQMKKFFKAVFLDKILKLRFCAGYEMDIGDRTVRAQCGFSFPSELADFMPNPHIDRYRCMGNYSQVIAECYSERDYIGVLQQCAASSVSLNFGDGTVMSEFARKILSREYENKKYVTLPDGTNVTHAGAIAWLESQEGTENEQTTEEA